MENEDPLVPDVSYGPSSTATVHITVLDVNESPVFYPDPMMVTKQENISVGSVLLTVNATDPDSLQRQTIRWVGVSVARGGRRAGAALPSRLPLTYRHYTHCFTTWLSRKSVS